MEKQLGVFRAGAGSATQLAALALTEVGLDLDGEGKP